MIDTETSPLSESQAVVIDASVWVSRLLPNDPNNQAAANWINNHIMSGNVFAAPALLAVEVAAAVYRRTKSTLGAQTAVNQLYDLPAMQLAPMDQMLIDEAAALSANLGVRGADALYVALAKQLGVPLVSFDNEQLALSMGLIPTIRP